LAEKQFRTIIGTVEFDPRDGEAGGKKVRNITVAQGGVKEQAIKVGATLWPSHSHVAVEKGDVVALRGSFTRNVVTKDDGSKVTYNNLSVTSLAVLGRMDEGKQVETVNDSADEPEDEDDIPF
jgi:hypothetical protein